MESHGDDETVTMPEARKKPCCICRRRFRPDNPAGDRQRAYGKPDCQSARRNKTHSSDVPEMGDGTNDANPVRRRQSGRDGHSPERHQTEALSGPNARRCWTSQATCTAIAPGCTMTNISIMAGRSPAARLKALAITSSRSGWSDQKCGGLKTWPKSSSSSGPSTSAETLIATGRSTSKRSNAVFIPATGPSL